MRSLVCPTLTLIAVLLAGGCKSDPPWGLAVETGFEGGSPQYVLRDDFSPVGHYQDSEGLVSSTSEPLIVRGELSWQAELSYLWHSNDGRSYAFGLGPGTPAVPLTPGMDHLVQLVLADPAAPVGQSRVLTSTQVRLHEDTMIVPVVVWNLGGEVPDFDETTARLMLDRAADTELPPGLDLLSWGRQRVDEVWAGCKIQFRLVGYRDLWLPQECWLNPPVSNQDPILQRCVSNRPACAANDVQTQDFLDCDQQEINRCTLLELLRWSRENSAYTGPELHVPNAVNVYFAPSFHLWENMTAGIGCRGELPFAAMTDVWSDGSGLRLAHELGHVMGLLEHTPDTVMGDASQRTSAVSDTLCEQTRIYVHGHYHWVD